MLQDAELVSIETCRRESAAAAAAVVLQPDEALKHPQRPAGDSWTLGTLPTVSE